eukprot:m.155184 g.155184  ORF g.155184 m.155184 type:complete len:79 (-) comp17933_c0_seq3:50-286(-)
MGIESEVINWFFAAPAFHPMVEGIFAYVLDQLREPSPGTPTSGKEGVWAITGTALAASTGQTHPNEVDMVSRCNRHYI